MKEDYITHKKELDEGKARLQKQKEDLNDKLHELDTLRRQIASCETKLYQAEQEELPESFDMNVLNEDLQYREGQMITMKNQLEVSDVLVTSAGAYTAVGISGKITKGGAAKSRKKEIELI